MSRAAAARSAEPCTYTGTLPGPTPKVGVPDACAVRTIEPVPVARISASRRWRISASKYSGWGFVTHWIAPAGAPAAVAASAQIRAASRMHFRAPRCGLKITGLRVFMQISDLKIVVDGGS